MPEDKSYEVILKEEEDRETKEGIKALLISSLAQLVLLPLGLVVTFIQSLLGIGIPLLIISFFFSFDWMYWSFLLAGISTALIGIESIILFFGNIFGLISLTYKYLFRG